MSFRIVLQIEIFSYEFEAGSWAAQLGGSRPRAHQYIHHVIYLYEFVLYWMPISKWNVVCIERRTKKCATFESHADRQTAYASQNHFKFRHIKIGKKKSMNL